MVADWLKNSIYQEMAQIKQTVELLTRILRCNGFSRIRSEIFRQAKFDQPEAVGFSAILCVVFPIISPSSKLMLLACLK